MHNISKFNYKGHKAKIYYTGIYGQFFSTLDGIILGIFPDEYAAIDTTMSTIDCEELLLEEVLNEEDLCE